MAFLIRCRACKAANRLGVEEHNEACAKTGERSYKVFPVYQPSYAWAMQVSRSRERAFVTQVQSEITRFTSRRRIER